MLCRIPISMELTRSHSGFTVHVLSSIFWGGSVAAIVSVSSTDFTLSERQSGRSNSQPGSGRRGTAGLTKGVDLMGLCDHRGLGRAFSHDEQWRGLGISVGVCSDGGVAIGVSWGRENA